MNMTLKDLLFSCDYYFGSIFRVILLIIIGLPLLSYVSRFFATFCTKRFSRHIGLLVGNLIFYGGIIFIGVNILHEFGFNVTALLGAAGVIGVAIGFASQTSVSNIISGFFLLLERPFSVGDTIKSGDVLGIAESIDLLAVRVRTFDNKLVRIPNEMVLKQSLTNLTFYPIKRVDLELSVVYNTTIETIKDIVFNIISSHSLFLKNPEPIIKINKIARPDFSTQTRLYIAIGFWVNKDKFFSAAGIFIELLKIEFDKQKIELDKQNNIITIIQVN